MPLRLVQVKFGDLANGDKFLGKIVGRPKRVKLIKIWDNRAKLEDRSSSMLYEFKDTELVYIWRWGH